MSFRARLFTAILLAVSLPLGALAWGVMREMERRLTSEYEGRVGSIASIIEDDLARESGALALRLRALAAEAARDNRLRLAVQRELPSRQSLLDYAGDAMRLSGLSMLQLQDSAGKIVSSGHFRNQFDQLQPELWRFLSSTRDTLLLVRTRTPEGSLVTLTRADSLRIGGRFFTLVGGIEVERRLLDQLARNPELSVALAYPGDTTSRSTGRRVVREVPLPYLDLVSASAAIPDTARFVVTQSLQTLQSLRRDVSRWFAIALALTVALAVLVAAWIASLVSRPLRDLARKTSEIDLDRLDQDFATDRRDEIGALSRLLGAMTERLRNSSARLRDAERRAAVGDLARQVNHDIKNGLAPIRNVLRHFAQVAREDPSRLSEVYADRRGTLESSVEYLDTLARNYDRLSPGFQRHACDVNAVVDQVLRTVASDGTALRRQLGEQLPQVIGDGLLVRRVLENLVGNAIDSTAGRSGAAVTVSTESAAMSDGTAGVRIIVADNGSGMTQSELDRAFDDFYTTKEGGTGLGLSIVRRVILDLNGTLRVETAPGVGTRVMVDLPGVPTREGTR